MKSGAFPPTIYTVMKRGYTMKMTKQVSFERNDDAEAALIADVESTFGRMLPEDEKRVVIDAAWSQKGCVTGSRIRESLVQYYLSRPREHSNDVYDVSVLRTEVAISPTMAARNALKELGIDSNNATQILVRNTSTGEEYVVNRSNEATRVYRKGQS